MRKFVTFTAGLCIGIFAGFLIRNSETADYNAGYHPANTEFNESDYFTEDVLEEKKRK